MAQTSQNDSFGPVLLAAAAISHPRLDIMCLISYINSK